MMTLQGQIAGSTLVSLLALLTLGAGDGGASTFEAGVIDANCIAVTLGPSPASDSWTNTTNGTGISSASGFAFGGQLGGDTSASSLGNTSAFNSAAACFMARMVVDDIVISGLGTDVSTQLSAHLSGSIATSTGTVSGIAVARLRAQTVAGAALSATASYNTGGVNGQNNVDTTLTTVSFTAPVGQPFAVRMIVESEISALDNAAPPDPVSGTTQFEMRFIQGAPVFSLPAGYTANSGDGNIVDNQFVDPSVPALDAQATAALMILLITLGAWTIFRRSRDLPSAH
jgi:hypothetical protein